MHFKINLIKDDVMPVSERKFAFLSLMLYLAVFGIFLTVLFYKTAVNFVSGTNYRREAKSLEKTYGSLYAGHKDIFIYAKELKSKMAEDADRLEAVNRVIAKKTELKTVIEAIASPLQVGSHIGTFNYKADGDILEFDIVIPEGRSKDATGELIRAWKGNSALIYRVKDMESVSSQRSTKGRDSVVVFKFSCRLISKKG